MKVLKEISKAWWNLFFYVAWMWFKELRGGWAIEVQIRDPFFKKKKQLLKTCILFELSYWNIVNILVFWALEALYGSICAYRCLIMKRFGSSVLFFQTSCPRNHSWKCWRKAEESWNPFILPIFSRAENGAAFPRTGARRGSALRRTIDDFSYKIKWLLLTWIMTA